MKLNEIHIRDPFVIKHNGKYYMYGSRGDNLWIEGGGFDVYISSDLENWSDPIEIFAPPAGFWGDRQLWAPEVHEYNGEFYLFATFNSVIVKRGTAILKAKAPEGPFVPHSDGAITPSDWGCLDGTLHQENGKNYMVFCNEWTQVFDGTMCAVELSSDLKSPIGEPKLLFKASDASWAKPITVPPDIMAIHPPGMDCYVTDGPCFYRAKNGDLLMLWSSFTEGDNYVQAISRSSDGTLFGNWTHESSLLYDNDGGHGMVFSTFDGKLMLTLHTPNTVGKERPAFFEIEEVNNTLVWR